METYNENFCLHIRVLLDGDHSLDKSDLLMILLQTMDMLDHLSTIQVVPIFNTKTWNERIGCDSKSVNF